MVEAENLTLVYLRRLDSKVDTVIEQGRDLANRVLLLETQMGQIVVTEQRHYAQLMTKLVGIEQRLDRLETHAELVQPTHSSPSL